MNKQAFLSALRDKLSGLPEKDLRQSIDYYSEIIDDRMEEGLSEEKAIQALGPMEEIVSQILSETSLPKLVKEKVKPKHTLKTWETVLLITCSPIWAPLLLAAVCILFSLYIVLWAVILVMYCIVFSFAAGAAAGLLGFFASMPSGSFAQGFAFLGAGLFCAGTAILLLLGFNQITKNILNLSKKLLLNIKARFIKKEEHNENK